MLERVWLLPATSFPVHYSTNPIIWHYTVWDSTAKKKPKINKLINIFILLSSCSSKTCHQTLYLIMVQNLQVLRPQPTSQSIHLPWIRRHRSLTSYRIMLTVSQPGSNRWLSNVCAQSAKSACLQTHVLVFTVNENF